MLGLYRNLTVSWICPHGELESATRPRPGCSVAALEWAVERIRELLALPGVPLRGGAERQTTSRRLTRARRPPSAASDCAMYMVVGLTDITRESSRSPKLRSVRARTTGPRRPAARDAELGTTRPRQGQALAGDAPMEVYFLADLDRFEEAQDTPLRAGRPPGAERVNGRDRGCSCAGLRDGAPALCAGSQMTDGLGRTGRPRRGGPRRRRYRARRDLDRSRGPRLRGTLRPPSARHRSGRRLRQRELASLYLVSARAQLARAEQLEARSGLRRRVEGQAQAFELSDRARALTLAALLADAADDTDDERMILAWRQATSEWQAAYDRLYRAYVTTADEEDVRGRIAELASAEEQLVEVEAELEGVNARTRAEPPPESRRPSRTFSGRCRPMRRSSSTSSSIANCSSGRSPDAQRTR